MKSKNILLILPIILISLTARSQVRNVVKDSLTNERIPYVNIWAENEMKGTTSDEKGEYFLSNDLSGKVIVFSSIGYKTKRKVYSKNDSVVFLQPEVTELKEVVVTSVQKSTRTEIGAFKKSEISFYFGCGGFPWMIGKYFSFEEYMVETPFLSQIEVLTSSSVAGSKFNVRLYTMSTSGTPNEVLYKENIIATAKKDKNITTIDLSKDLVEIPRSGILVAIEFLIIDSNYFEYKYTKKGSKEELIGHRYEPLIGTVPSESENSWEYVKGQWRISDRVYYSNGKYKGKYAEPAVKLTLIN